MPKSWWTCEPAALVAVAVSFVVVYAAIIALTRVVGLRSFSKMSASDFAMTVAVGSLFASSISSASPPLPVALLALGLLFAGQWVVAYTRRRSETVAKLIDNQPLLLVRDGRVIEENMRRANVSPSDLRAKLREANALSLDRVHAVVFETTGDVSVLHGDRERSVDDFVLADVVGSEASPR